MEQTKVVLRGEDGGEFEVEFAKLSKADQQYVDAHTPDPFKWSTRPRRLPKAPPLPRPTPACRSGNGERCG